MKTIFACSPKTSRTALALALASALMLCACSGGRITKVTPEAGVLSFTASRGEAWKLADELWRERRDAQKAWASLLAYRRATEEQPQVAELWTRYARACYFLATYTEQNQEWSNPERSKKLYLEGARAAEAALQLHPAYRNRLALGGDEADAVRALAGAWLEPAFWMAANRGRWALGENRRARTEGRGRFEPLMRGLAGRNGWIYYGGPERFLGVLFLASPRPQADSARVHFDKAREAAPLFFANLTLRAEYLSVYEKDTASFRELLEEVLRLPTDAVPEAAIENEFEQARARDLLSRQRELFP